MARKDIIKLIQNRQEYFTVNQRKFAKFVVDNISKIALSDINELSKNSDVSTATINRFCKQMGYSGFYSFKKDLKKIVSREINFSKRIDIRKIDFSIKENIFYKSILNDKKALDTLMMKNPIEKFVKAIEIISNAKNIFLQSSRSSSFSTLLFCYYLMQLENNVINVINEANYFERIVNISSKDLLISLNLPFYHKQGIKLIDYARNKKAKIILITDSLLAPNSEKANVTFLVEHKTLSFLKNYTAVNALINALITALVFEKKDKYKSRLNDIYNLVKKASILEM